MFENLFFYFQFLPLFAASHCFQMCVLAMVLMTVVTMVVISECKYLCDIDVGVPLTLFCRSLL